MPSQTNKTVPKRLKIGTARPVHAVFQPYTKQSTVTIAASEVGHALRP